MFCALSLPVSFHGTSSHSIFTTMQADRRQVFFLNNYDEQSPPDPVDSLVDKLSAALVDSRFDDKPERFLPDDKVSVLVTEDSIVEAIGIRNLEELAQSTSSSKWRPFVQWIKRWIPKIFLILIKMNLKQSSLLGAVIQFNNNSIADDALPIIDNHLCTDLCKTPCSISKLPNQLGWRRYYHDQFRELQWQFLSPVFREEKETKTYDFHVNTILPFIERDAKETGTGAFSTVSKATIYPSHGDPRFLKVAIKEIDIKLDIGGKNGAAAGSNELDRERQTDLAWELEARALNMANRIDDEHMVKCLAIIRKGKRRFFMFPWADGGSLQNFWERHPQPRLTRELVRDVLQQLKGLAGALNQLHNYAPENQAPDQGLSLHKAPTVNLDDKTVTSVPEVKVNGQTIRPTVVNKTPHMLEKEENAQSEADLTTDKTVNVPDMEVNGQPVIITENGHQSIRHGDLKPENILQFLSDEELESTAVEIGHLKIADLGLAKRHVVATQLRDKATSTRYGTALYEAPEVAKVQKNKGRSRLYDIWSMGCIMFEFLVWMLYGNEAVNELHRQLRNSQKAQYYEVAGGKTQVHRVVQRWFTHMESNDPGCSPNSAIGELLKLIKSKVLIVELPNPSTDSSSDTESHVPARVNSQQLLAGLTSIQERFVRSTYSSDLYLPEYAPRDNIKYPVDGYMASKASPSSLEVPAAGSLGLAKKSNLPVRHASQTGKSIKTAKADYTTPPFEDWEYPVDNTFARKVVGTLGHDALQPKSPQSITLCDDCKVRDFWQPGFSIEMSLTDLQRQSTVCSFCAMLWSAHRRRSGFQRLPKVRFERVSSNLRLEGADSTLPALSIVRNPDLHPPLPIQVGFPELQQPKTPDYFRLLSLWLQDCDDNHKSCRSAHRIVFPTRLIDVGTPEDRSLRLIETREVKLDGDTDRYIALSHPWGNPAEHPPFSTLRTDPSGNQRDLATLKTAIPYPKLPLTFQHAIDTTRKLGIRYLWIDSLCIIQGEDGDFEEESKHMEDVFSCAYCVLAASRAKGQTSGFLGPIPKRSYVTFERESEKPFYVCEAIDDFNRDVLEGHLNTRGWILQERALARRTIFFTETQTYFECGSGVRSQSLAKLHNNMADFLGDSNFPEKTMKAQRGLKIAYFQDLFKLYSRLKFSHIEDRPFAIEGLENRLRAAYNTKGAFGILDDGPGKGLFHRSLLWIREEDDDENNPNLSMDPIYFPKGRKVSVPSWSWMAYKGRIDYLVPPLDGSTAWEKDDIHPPQPKQSKTASSERNETSTRVSGMEIIALVRPFDIAGHSTAEAKLVQDRVQNETDGSPKQCVIVAKSKEGETVAEKTHWVLLVSPLSTQENTVEVIYERVGAGYMLGKFITFKDPAMPARII
ncbi:hypothetical protein F5Y16DRAFT_248365 [Xylariaceae sp. FL0255]|nr:hypothetical protein F5Y16DRAFT_248365 [Xylariaceae sp. FL0255]